MGTFRPRVSVVIPVYNGANYLATAIDSALAQTYDNVEVLVIDDGSTDGGATEAIARRYGNRVRYHRKQNGGVSSALNTGIALMEGEYFSWLSHDDRYLPEKLQRQVEFVEKHAEVEALATGLEVIDAYGGVTSSYSCGDTCVIDTGREVMDHWIYGCSLLIRKGVFDRVGGFNESNRTVQDLEMWLKIVHKGTPITMLPDILCQWRRHDESDSTRLKPHHVAEINALLHKTAKEFGLAFFRASNSERMTRREAQSVYAWFALQATNRGCGAKMSAEFYRRALAAYPNLFSLPFWHIFRQYAANVRAATR